MKVPLAPASKTFPVRSESIPKTFDLRSPTETLQARFSRLAKNPRESLTHFAGWRTNAGLHRLVLTFLLVFASHAQARSFVVSNGADTTRQDSLRGAILEANRRGGSHTIFLSDRNYVLTLNGIDEDVGATGDLDITGGNLLIIGRGRDVTIDASELGDRIFQIFPGANVRLVNVTCKGGQAYGDAYADWAHFDGDSGGAFHNSGSLLLKRCKITGNSAGGGGTLLGNAPGGRGGLGGGIYNLGTLTLVDCVIDGNSGGLSGPSSFGGDGGGIYNLGVCILSRCTISGNTAGDGRGAAIGLGDGAHGGDGGGVCNFGKMRLSRCTIAHNRTGSGANGNLPGSSTPVTPGGPGGAAGDGAAISNSGKLRMVLCTVSGNTNGLGGIGGNGAVGGSGGRGGNGGGIYNDGELLLTSSTVVLNNAGQGGTGGDGWGFSGPAGGIGGAGGNGGGIFSAPNGFVNTRNSLVTLNAAGYGGVGGQENGSAGATGGGIDLVGSFDSEGYNLIGILEDAAASFESTATDQFGTLAAPIDPLIGLLQQNEGKTATHALLPGSPALDQGKRFGLGRDQRGEMRRYDFPDLTNSFDGDGTDIGTFELQTFEHDEYD